MRAAGTAELYVPIDVSASFLSHTATRLRREYPGLAGRAGGRRHQRGAQPPAALPAPGALRLPRQHHRQLLPDRRHPAAAAGAGRDGAGRPVPDGRRPAEGSAAGSRPPTTTAAASRRSSTATCCGCSTTSSARISIPRPSTTGPSTRRQAHRIEMHLVASEPQEVTIPGIGTGRFAEGEIAPHRDQLQARPRAASTAHVPSRPGSASSRGAPTREGSSRSSSGRPA